MSTRVMDCCWGLWLPPSEKSVLMSLADQANDAGVCWPGVGSLCERTCLGERTVQRALRSLEDRMLLVCDLRAMKTNRYTLNIALLKQMEREREARRGEGAGLRQASLDLPAVASHPVTMAPRHGDTPPQRHPDPATVAPLPRHSGTQTVIEPIQIHTPHTPQPAAGGLETLDVPKGEVPLSSLADWLKFVQASGQDAVPETDEVWDYASTVGLPREFVALCWREFKRRQLQAGKRRRDWRAHFRECVMGSWYGLWLLSAGQDARLSTAGEQAMRFFEALDNRQSVEAS